jgi:hypothetical protein
MPMLRWIVTGVALLTAACGSAEAQPPGYAADVVITDDAVYEFVKGFGDGGLTSLSGGEGGDVTDVYLTAESEDLAAAMLDYFDGRFEITVGAWPYPMPDGVAARCDEDPVERGSTPGIEVRIELDSASIALGEQLSGEVFITNTTEWAADAVYGYEADAVLVDRGTTRVRTVTYGWRKVSGGGSSEDSGVVELPLRVDLATCDPAEGYVVAPGDYDVVFMGAAIPITIGER